MRLVDHQEVEGAHGLAVGAAQCAFQGARRGAGLLVALVVVQPLGGEAGVRREHQQRTLATGPQGELGRVGRAPHVECFQQRVSAQTAHRDGRGTVADRSPGFHGLSKKIQRRDEDADHASGDQPQRGDGRSDGLARAGGHVDLPALPRCGHRAVQGEGQAFDDRVHGLDLMWPKRDPLHTHHSLTTCGFSGAPDGARRCPQSRRSVVLMVTVAHASN